jgi:Zn ribbon nucleic-acid-binding protein
MNPQQAPIFNSGYVDPGNTFIHSSSINHHASQNQQFRSPPPTPAYPSSAYSATWNSAPPTQQWATSSHASMPPPGGHSYHDPRHHNPYPNNPQPYHPSPPHAQILLTEASGDQDANISRKVCSHCRATSTPTWRRDPRTHKTLCNACGVYLAQRQHLRPQKLIDVDNEDPRGGDSEGEYDGPECSNCGTRKTSTWRRNRAGAQVCNACGVYERTNGRPRPLALRNDKVRPREKHRGTD